MASFFDRGNNKAIILGYDEIIASPNSVKSCLYCLQQNEVEALIAVLEPLEWVTRWFSETNAFIDPNVVYNFSAVIQGKLMNGCCGDIPLTRFTADGTFQESDDGGITWFDALSDDPRNGTIGFPPVAGDDGDDKKCAGANSLVTYFKNAQISIKNAKDAEASAADISAIIVGILIVVGVITGGWMFAFIGELIALIYANLTAAEWDAAFTTDTWQKLVCIFFDNMQDDASFTLAGWETVIGAVEAAGFSSTAVDFLTSTIKALRETGLSNVARSSYGGALDCTCSDNCSSIASWNEQIAGVLGTIVDRDDTSITVAADFYTGGGYYATSITTGDPDVCCTLIGLILISGTKYDNAAWSTCGHDPSLAADGAGTGYIGISVNLIFNSSNAPFTVKYEFSS